MGLKGTRKRILLDPAKGNLRRKKREVRFGKKKEDKRTLKKKSRKFAINWVCPGGNKKKRVEGRGPEKQKSQKGQGRTKGYSG